MLVLSIAFLGFYLWSSLSMGDTRIADAGIWIIWGMFAIDYLVRFSLAERKFHWFIRHPHELVLVAIPMFRPLRILRLVSILLVFQRFAAANIHVTVALYTVVTTSLILLIGSLTLYGAERHVPSSAVNSYWDALWWSVVTVTTVGYGDIAPVTMEGRVAAGLLMVGGIALVGQPSAPATSSPAPACTPTASPPLAASTPTSASARFAANTTNCRKNTTTSSNTSSTPSPNLASPSSASTSPA